MSVLLAVVAIVFPHGASHKTLVEHVGPRCDQHHPRGCVTRAVRHYHFTGWRRDWMYRIPGCESTWNPFAYFGNGGNRVPRTSHVYAYDIATGLYEFKPSTWRTTPFGPHSIWSAYWQARAAGYMIRAGRTGEWACR